MKIYKKLNLILVALLILISFSVFADLPPDPGGGPGGGDLPVGGGSPIGGGLITLLIAGFTYGIVRFNKLRKKDL